MLRIKRIIPALALLALIGCTDAVGPTDPPTSSVQEGVEEQNQAGRDGHQRGGEQSAEKLADQ